MLRNGHRPGGGESDTGGKTPGWGLPGHTRRLIILFVIPIAVVLVTLAVRWTLHPVIGDAAPLLLFLIPILISAYLGGLVAGLVATAFSAAAVSYVLLAPRSSLMVSGPVDQIRVGLFVIEGVIISAICHDLRRVRRKATRAEDAERAAKRHLEEQAGEIMESISEAFYALDSDYRFTFANRRALTLFDLEQDEVIGKGIFELFPALRGTDLAQGLQRTLTEREPVAFETASVRAGRWFDAHLFPKENGVSVYLQDVTDRRTIQKALENSESRLRLLYDISEATRELTDPEQILAVATQMLGRHLGASRCAYADVELNGDDFIIRQDYTDGCDSARGRYQLSDFGSRVFNEMRQGRTLVIRDVERELAPDEGGEAFSSIGVKAIICCPLVKTEGLTGMMAVHQVTPRDWTDEQIRLVEMVVERSWAFIERARIDRSLRESEGRFRTMADNIAQLAWMADANGWNFWYNQRWYDYTGTTFGEMVGDGWQKLLPPDHADRVINKISRHWESGEVWEDTFPIRGADGEYRWFLSRAIPVHDAQGRIALWFGTNTDVTEQRQAQQVLKESESRFRAMADAAPAMMWVTDGDGQCTFLSRAWQEFTGQSEAQGRGFGWVDAIHPDDREVVADVLRTSSDRGEPFSVDYRLRHADGEWRWAVHVGRPRFDDQGRFTGYVGVVVDITERKEAEEERAKLLDAERAARAEADRNSRLKDEFLATLSHELRTPLNAILGWVHLLQGDSLDPRELSEGLKTIERNARNQVALVEDLLDVSRIISGKISVDLNEIDLLEPLRSACDAVRPSAQAKGIALNFNPSVEEAAVLGDAARIQQVFWNLLSNAIKFTSEGGRIDVYADSTDQGLQVTVTDTGQGIARDFLPHIFERFRQADQTTTRRHGGLGLGLSIVHRIIELHGGSVVAESEGVGRGARFTVRLPRLPSDITSPGVDFAPEQSPEGLQEECLSDTSVLVVDDEEDSCDVMRRVLQAAGARVITANSTAEGLELIRLHRPDVLVTDIGMPDEDGYTFVRKLLATDAIAGGRMPIIAVTAFAREQDRALALDGGFDEFLTKPLEPEDLVGAVYRSLQKFGLKNEKSAVPHG